MLPNQNVNFQIVKGLQLGGYYLWITSYNKTCSKQVHDCVTFSKLLTICHNANGTPCSKQQLYHKVIPMTSTMALVGQKHQNIGRQLALNAAQKTKK